MKSDPYRLTASQIIVQTVVGVTALVLVVYALAYLMLGAARLKQLFAHRSDVEAAR